MERTYRVMNNATERGVESQKLRAAARVDTAARNTPTPSTRALTEADGPRLEQMNAHRREFRPCVHSWPQASHRSAKSTRAGPAVSTR